MNITFNLNDHEWQEFKSQEEWDNCQYSYHYRTHKWRHGTYQTTARWEPERFPCIGLFLGTIHQDNSYDEENIAWIYDYTIN